MIKKTFLKNKPVCKVTFELPAEVAQGATDASIAGDFSNWNAEPMKRLKNGRFKTTLNLETGKDYQFRYVIDNEKWVNDAEADKYVSNNLTFEDNSVVCL